MEKVTWVLSEAFNQNKRSLSFGIMGRVLTTGALNSMTYESWKAVQVASSMILYDVIRAFSSHYLAPDGFVLTACLKRH